MAIKGIKSYGIITDINTPISQQILFGSRINEATLGKEIEKFEAKAFTEQALLETVDTVLKSNTWTFTIGMQSFDWQDMQLIFGEHEATTTSAKLPIIKTGTVPSSTPFEVVDTDLDNASVTDIAATLVSDGTNEPVGLTVIDTGTVATKQVKLDETNTKLVFFSDAAGKPYKYILHKSFANIKSIGVEAAAKTLDNIQWFGLVVGPRLGNGFLLRIPRMGRSGGFEFGIADETSVSLEFNPSILGSNKSAVQLYKLP